MNNIGKIPNNSTLIQAISEIKQKIKVKYSVIDIILFGSAARGESDEESDIDILIITAEPMTRFKRHEITDIVFDINLQYSTNFSTLVVDQKSWETGMVSYMPVHDEITRDGIYL
jgi:uncharacterized protein